MSLARVGTRNASRDEKGGSHAARNLQPAFGAEQVFVHVEQPYIANVRFAPMLADDAKPPVVSIT